MKIMYLGEVVRQQRKKLGVPQDMVCEGLCTPMTLSRFESGRQTPSWDCVVAILQRLGLPDDRYYAQLTRMETKLVLLRKEALAYYKRYEHTLGEDRQQACMNTLETLHKLERCIKEDDHMRHWKFQRSVGKPASSEDIILRCRDFCILKQNAITLWERSTEAQNYIDPHIIYTGLSWTQKIRRS